MTSARECSPLFYCTVLYSTVLLEYCTVLYSLIRQVHVSALPSSLFCTAAHSNPAVTTNTESLPHCVTMSLCQCAHSLTMSICHCVTVSLSHCVTVLTATWTAGSRSCGMPHPALPPPLPQPKLRTPAAQRHCNHSALPGASDGFICVFGFSPDGGMVGSSAFAAWAKPSPVAEAVCATCILSWVSLRSSHSH